VADVVSNIEHDDVVMYYLIESIYNLRNKQYSEFFDKGYYRDDPTVTPFSPH
jgi:hypothetical protein